MTHRTLVLCAALALSCATATTAATTSPRPATADPHIWLEDVTGTKALAWVKKQNAQSTKIVTASPSFPQTRDRFLEVLNSTDKIPWVSKMGPHYYNFWRDKDHVRGLWRRTTLEEYRTNAPAWETVLDLDALGAAEKENWVWEGASPLVPEYTRCLIQLSRGGADASVVREFDLTTKQFVPDGFTLPEAKSSVAWHDRNTLFVGTDFGAGSLTTSGYPRVAKMWTRGTPLSSATVVFEGQSSDVSAIAYTDRTPGFERDFVARGTTFFTNETYVLRGGQPVKIDKPDDADASVHREWLFLRLRSDWTTGGRTWPGGSLLACRFDEFLNGSRTFDALFTPSERTSLDDFSPTLNTVIVSELDNVKSKLYVLRYTNGAWSRTPLGGMPEIGVLDASAVDDMESDDYFLTSTGFLTPTSLSLGTAGGAAPVLLKHEPEFFDPSPYTVTQHEAVSADGTRVPYFQVARSDLALDGAAPTILHGYGGFEVAMTPYYSGSVGRGWLERGGVFVIANIRGGGEFGPRWHQAALLANRPRAYEDFIAVAEDLSRRRVTSATHLGCMGGSNGGLLVGNMLTMRPDLWGAIVCQQPLLDMRRYNKLLAGASWMAEYGDPDKPEEWAFIRTFSAYHNASKTAHYPPTLFTSSTRDDRVHPGHARKMVARLQAQGHPHILYYENVEGGHAGAADNTQRAFMSAMAYEFLWQHLK